MKFQWYVIDLEEGGVTGSNDVEEIREHLTDDSKVVLTAQHGKYYHGSTVEREVKPVKADEDEDDDIGDDPETDPEGEGNDD